MATYSVESNKNPKDMPKARAGTTAQVAAHTGPDGELTYDETLKSLQRHDGSTAGGIDLNTDATHTRPIISGLTVHSVTDTITAGTTISQAGATALTTEINNLTVVANSADAVRLPVAVAGAQVTVINNGIAAASVWPATGDAINSGAANAMDVTTLAIKKVRVFTSPAALKWYSFDLPA